MPGDFANDYFESQFLGICLDPCPWGSYLLDYRVDGKCITVLSFQRMLSNLLRVISLHKGVKERSFPSYLFSFFKDNFLGVRMKRPQVKSWW